MNVMISEELIEQLRKNLLEEDDVTVQPPEGIAATLMTGTSWIATSLFSVSRALCLNVGAIFLLPFLFNGKRMIGEKLVSDYEQAAKQLEASLALEMDAQTRKEIVDTIANLRHGAKALRIIFDMDERDHNCNCVNAEPQEPSVKLKVHI